METEWGPHVRQAMGDETTSGSGSATGKKRLTGRKAETQMESKAQHQKQEQIDQRQGQQTKMQLKMPTKGPDVPTDAEMNAYKWSKLPQNRPATQDDPPTRIDNAACMMVPQV